LLFCNPLFSYPSFKIRWAGFFFPSASSCLRRRPPFFKNYHCGNYLCPSLECSTPFFPVPSPRLEQPLALPLPPEVRAVAGLQTGIFFTNSPFNLRRQAPRFFLPPACRACSGSHFPDFFLNHTFLSIFSHLFPFPRKTCLWESSPQNQFLPSSFNHPENFGSFPFNRETEICSSGPAVAWPFFSPLNGRGILFVHPTCSLDNSRYGVFLPSFFFCAECLPAC